MAVEGSAPALGALRRVPGSGTALPGHAGDSSDTQTQGKTLLRLCVYQNVHASGCD